jgi:hypothetical protein
LRLTCESRRHESASRGISRPVGATFGVILKNFFDAWFGDSTRAEHVFSRLRLSLAINRISTREFCCNQEMPVPQGFLACLTRHCLRFTRVLLRRDSTLCAHRVDHAAQLRSHRHQLFLKRRSGFFILLVYSNCSASRIARCTTLTSHLTLEGNMAKKAKKAKKTAKKAAKKKKAKKK